MDILAADMRTAKREISEEAALRLVIEGTASETGTEFFRALVRNLAAAMDKNIPNSDSFVAAVSKAIDDMRKDGTLTKLAVKWYGVDLSTKKQ